MLEPVWKGALSIAFYNKELGQTEIGHLREDFTKKVTRHLCSSLMLLNLGSLHVVDAAETRFPAALSLCTILVGTMWGSGGLGFSALSPNVPFTITLEFYL